MRYHISLFALVLAVSVALGEPTERPEALLTEQEVPSITLKSANQGTSGLKEDVREKSVSQEKSVLNILSKVQDSTLQHDLESQAPQGHSQDVPNGLDVPQEQTKSIQSVIINDYVQSVSSYEELKNQGTPKIQIQAKSASMNLLARDDAAAKSVEANLGENQIENFNSRQILVQRILATSSSCASIALSTLGVYTFLAIDPRRLIFRHQLISFLLFFDLLKAVVLLLYPTRVLTHSSAYYNDRFCQIVGFFTATAIEGADIAILAFAVHTYLLIFNHNLTTKVKNSSRTEGGLYKFRYYVYVLSFLIPLVLASLAFINAEGYASLVCWCYLPQQPIWYRLVLSWVPRYCIVIAIVVIYCSIYFHVIREFKTLGGVFTTIHRAHLPVSLDPDTKPSFFSAFVYFYKDLEARFIPQWTLPEGQYNRRESGLTVSSRSKKKSEGSPEEESESSEEDQRKPAPDLEQNAHSTDAAVPTENVVFDPEMHAANLAKFRKRQKIIEKQMKSIFIYPFAYCFVWLFPFILFITQIHYEEKYGPIYWINCMGAFMQPFNGFVNALVFFYREQPWRYTIMLNFEKDHAAKLDNLISTGLGTGSGSIPKRRDSDVETTSARWTKASFGASTGMIETETYPLWRQWMSWLRLPLFILPTDESIDKFQTKYLSEKLSELRSDSSASAALAAVISNTSMASPTRARLSSDPINTNVFLSAGAKKHDFSNILLDDPSGRDFRSNFENFSFQKEKQKRSSLTGSSITLSASPSSSKFGSIYRSRQPSSSEPPVGGTIVEGRKTSFSSSPHSNNPQNILNNYNSHLEIKKKRFSTPSIRNTLSIGHVKRHRTASVASAAIPDEDDTQVGEMDFLEFLQKP